MMTLRRTDGRTMHAEVLRGLPYSPLEEIQAFLRITIEEMAGLLQIPVRTLARRKAAGKLDPPESDRLVRAATLLGEAVALFEGDEENARRWFMAGNAALGGSSPFDMARTDVGSREVSRLIGRLEYGVIA
jgi:putative toxin-antitoxin system antitoxin component (TIGR02293 family)